MLCWVAATATATVASTLGWLWAGAQAVAPKIRPASSSAPDSNDLDLRPNMLFNLQFKWSVFTSICGVCVIFPENQVLKDCKSNNLNVMESKSVAFGLQLHKSFAPYSQ
jgi:hypothetical protein